MTKTIQRQTTTAVIPEDMSEVKTVTYGKLQLPISDQHRELAAQAQYSMADHARVVKYAGKAGVEQLLRRIRTQEDLSKNLGAPTISDISKYDSSDQAIAVVGMIIEDRLKLRKTDNTLNAAQFAFLASDLVHEHPHITITELIYAITQGIRGRYGEIYNTIQIDTIYRWIDQYYATDRPSVLQIAKQRREAQSAPTPKVVDSKTAAANAKKLTEIAQAAAQARQLPKASKHITLNDLRQYCHHYSYNYDTYCRRIQKLAGRLLQQREDVTITLDAATQYLHSRVVMRHNKPGKVQEDREADRRYRVAYEGR